MPNLHSTTKRRQRTNTFPSPSQQVWSQTPSSCLVACPPFLLLGCPSPLLLLCCPSPPPLPPSGPRAACLHPLPPASLSAPLASLSWKLSVPLLFSVSVLMPVVLRPGFQSNSFEMQGVWPDRLFSLKPLFCRTWPFSVSFSVHGCRAFDMQGLGLTNCFSNPLLQGLAGFCSLLLFVVCLLGGGLFQIACFRNSCFRKSWKAHHQLSIDRRSATLP